MSEMQTMETGSNNQTDTGAESQAPQSLEATADKLYGDQQQQSGEQEQQTQENTEGEAGQEEGEQGETQKTEGAPEQYEEECRVHRPELCLSSRDPPRERAVRSREGSLHRCGRTPAGQVRAGQQGYPVPGRDRGVEPDNPGEAPPCSGAG